MRVACLSDIHANLIALEAVLDDIPSDVDELLCAGDVVGYNPWPQACIEAVRERAIPTVAGNHDRMVNAERNFRGNGMAAAGIVHARNRLSAADREWLADRPVELRAIEDRVKVVHGHPDDPDRYTYPDQFGPDLLGDEAVLILGHTHVQHHEVYDDGVVLNPGSVGQPRDEDPRAAYAILDIDTLSVDERRVEYDIDAVAEAIETAGLPEDTATRLYRGR